MNPTEIASCQYLHKRLAQLWFHCPKFLKSPTENVPVVETVPAIHPEIGTEEIITIIALSLTKSYKFGNAKIIDCRCFSNLKNELTF